MDETPGSTKINFNRVRNLETPRLRRRLEWLETPVVKEPDRAEAVTNLGLRARELDSHSGSGRGPMADAAKEVLLIRQELERRDASREDNLREWTAELDAIICTMDVPARRRTDFRWMSRNLHINNLDHPDFKRASRLVRKILSEIS